MRKYYKTVAAVMSLIMTTGLCGCSMKESVDDYIGNMKKAAEYNERKDYSDNNDAGTAESTGETTDSEQQNENAENIVIKAGQNSDIIFEFTPEGKLVRKYDLNDIYENNGSGYELAPYNNELEKDGILYYNCYLNEEDSYGYAVIAYNPGTQKATKVIMSSGQGYFVDFDIYNGCLYVTENISTTDSTQTIMHCFIIGDNGESFTETDPIHKDLYDKYSDYRFSFINSGYCCDRALDEFGCIVGSFDGELYVLSIDGSLEKIESVPKTAYVRVFDDSSVIYYSYKEGEYTKTGDFYLNRKTGITVPVSDDSVFNLIKFGDGNIYYYTLEEQEYGINTVKVIKENIESGARTVLLERQNIPGVYGYNPGADSFTIAGDKVFFTDFANNKISFFMGDLTENEIINIHPIDCDVREIEIFKYGQVKSISKSFKCPTCGIPLSEGYFEYLVLDDKTDAGVKITDCLKDNAFTLSQEYGNIVEVSSEDCKVHEESDYKEQFCESDCETISGAGTIDDRYFYVNLEGYYYAGGAHGMPYREQMLFDLDTGERKYLRDFYTEDEDSFKSLIAEKVREDYNRYTAGGPYFAADDNEAYGNAFEYANIDGNVTFTQEGIVYSFNPYDLGPFSSGFISVTVPYSEFLGRATLSDK